MGIEKTTNTKKNLRCLAMQYEKKRKRCKISFQKGWCATETIYARPCPFGCQKLPIIQFGHRTWLKHFTMHLCCSRIVFP